MKPTITIMCGLARSGKGTWIKRNKGDAVIISPDDIRSEIFGHQFHKGAEVYVWALAESMGKLLLDQNVDIIIDATNTTYSARKTWIDIAKGYKAKVRIIWVKTSLADCLKRNEKSIIGQQVPVEVLYGMAESFQNPLYAKSEDIELIQHPSKLRAIYGDDYSKASTRIMNHYEDELAYTDG